ncbi:MAG TPA: hypothetical protein PLY75_11085 [Gammaproteobacteria bacterium]|nr:hypothetical protein [Gammaproteobacteria bacterium]HPQ25467.1 hypothetical protein [Gammaproteobacteria bacterium]
MASNARTDGHRWRFNQLGGFDQVVIDSAEDIRHLPELNQKLWAALSCPTTGVEFDRHTLALLDTDGDGRIRVPEVLAAAQWVCKVLKDPNELFERTAGLPLASINDSDDEGAQLLASARRILENVGSADATVITAAETADTNKIFAETRFNGDGVVPVASAEDAGIAKVIEEVITCVGSVPDRSGAEGIDQDLLDRFFAEVTAFSEWWAEAEADAANVRPLGDATEQAASVYEAVEAKINDYFTRSRLVAFDTRAAPFLNPGEAEYTALAHKTLSSATEELAAFPLARVEADRPLSLEQQLNPGWSAALGAFRDQVAVPLLGNVSELTAAQWDDISSRFAAHSAWRARHRGDAVAALGWARVKELAGGDTHATITGLIEQDKELAGVADAIASVDRLVHYYQHLDTLLHNFVSLRDFYSADRKAIFQAGTLYLDGRSCELCVVVSDVAAHSALATRSQTYLAYCDCRRRAGQEKMTIAAAFTGGDADNLMVGRNGVFYDRTGADWDATITKVIEHPISISQAFWSPYKRIGRMISQQIEKFAGAQDKAVEDSAAKGVGDLSAKAQDGKAAAPFDIGKFAGIFAAIGLAVGAIGTALAAVLTGFLGLSWWEMPLAVGGLMLLISGPSMIMAYMKLRQRNLGPILDANGWAVNTAARINIPFGSTLTGTAELPSGAQRSMRDPFADKKRPWKFYLFLVVVFAVLGALWQKGYLGEWWSQLQHKTEQATTQVAPAPADPAPAAPAEAVKPAS